MKAACFEYKCRRCGRIDRSLGCGADGAFMRLVDLMVCGRDNGPGFPVTMLGRHSCSDGGTGVTDLQGFGFEEEG